MAAMATCDARVVFFTFSKKCWTNPAVQRHTPSDGIFEYSAKKASNWNGFEKWMDVRKR
ncbi:hypothetical protein MRS76_07970 [Rhizobiaceae bacterium n13]|uniref:hypothetical protein n=1 Tax=Ferirhizobium litorale TaxID=2927786 RepID=UPI0024B2B5B7|nr:hypothetical protein [Fererhizobium litorale]MDI7861893.1 hypothetical protein [Fererhizobium litorale]